MDGLEKIRDAALEFVRDSYAPTAKYDVVRWLRLCQALGYEGHESYFDLLQEMQEEGVI